MLTESAQLGGMMSIAIGICILFLYHGYEVTR